jgi:hypothetical protein
MTTDKMNPSSLAEAVRLARAFVEHGGWVDDQADVESLCRALIAAVEERDEAQKNHLWMATQNARVLDERDAAITRAERAEAANALGVRGAAQLVTTERARLVEEIAAWHDAQARASRYAVDCEAHGGYAAHIRATWGQPDRRVAEGGGE